MKARERRVEYVRPGDRLVLLDRDSREIVVRGRDRVGTNWWVVLLVWVGALLIHVVLR